MVKYFLSLCCIIKNERYLEEFIIYYRIMGVEHFYIYDNESTIPIQERLSHSFYKDMCTILDIKGRCRQMDAYNDCLKNFGNETKWLIICDGDEYIVPKKDNHWSIRDFLNEYNNAHAIGINWVMFGTSFHNTYQDGYLIDKYRYSSKEQDSHIKTICQPKHVISCEHPHIVRLKDPSKYIDCKRNIIKGPFNNNHTIDLIQINHYHFRSVEEINEKFNRGNADTENKIYVPPNPHELNNDIINNIICDKYLSSVSKILDSLK